MKTQTSRTIFTNCRYIINNQMVEKSNVTFDSDLAFVPTFGFSLKFANFNGPYWEVHEELVEVEEWEGEKLIEFSTRSRIIRLNRKLCASIKLDYALTTWPIIPTAKQNVCARETKGTPFLRISRLRMVKLIRYRVNRLLVAYNFHDGSFTFLNFVHLMIFVWIDKWQKHDDVSKPRQSA